MPARLPSAGTNEKKGAVASRWKRRALGYSKQLAAYVTIRV
jgi:hypothetical protein